LNYHLIEPKIDSDNVVDILLSNRGIEDINHYLHTTNEDILDPLLLGNMNNGAKLLIQHISLNHKIFIQVDSDCDGYTSAAILINYLYKLFPAFVQNNIIYKLHTGKQHGIILETIPEDVKLLVVPDAGSNNYEEHKTLKEKGIDVLIIDHHEAERISTDACVINNQLSVYPNKTLSGAGVVYKFCSYIDSLLGTEYAEDFIDLATLGIIADMVDLREYETRHIITKGLKNINNRFIKLAVEKNEYSLKGDLTPTGVSFYIAPYINAMVRSGTQEEKLTLFEALLDFKAEELIPSTKRGCKGQQEMRVVQAYRNCTNTKNRQAKSRDNNLEVIENIIEEQNLLDNKILTICLNKNYSVDKNLTGLVANQLMAKYQRPVLILNERLKENNISTWEGSGRAYDKANLGNFREFLLNTQKVMYCEGHASAFGVGITNEELNDFIQVTNDLLKDVEYIPVYDVDFIFNSYNFDGQDVVEIAELKSLWGQGIKEPYIALENIRVTKDNITLMSPDKSPTIKITLPNGTEIVKFKSSEEEFKNLYSELGYIEITVIGRCEKNEWYGNITPQILVEDYEITNRMEYYF